MSRDAAASAHVINVITGPTAAGKSSLAMELARRFALALVSADSRQVYRGFDIGTAKPDAQDQRDVLHFGIDVHDPRDRYSAHAWSLDALGWMQQARALQKTPVIVGGTGFYVRALVRPLAPAPAFDADRRARLGKWLAQQDMITLQRWCGRLDPARSDLGRTQLERAVETALLAGTRLSDHHAAHIAAGQAGPNVPVGSHGTPLRVRYLVVDPGPPLADRIRTRVHTMMEHGWTEEARTLMTAVPESAPAWLASGYGVMREHVRGTMTRAQAIERVVIETRQYAKRQRTWCRHQLTEGPVTRISPDEPHALDRALAWLNETERDTR